MDEAVKTDLSDPDLIVRPPTDPYSLSFTPPMPEGAEAILTPAQCKKAGGNWHSVKYPAEEIKEVGCLVNNRLVGRWMTVEIQTPESAQTEENALGYSWYADDKPHGWHVEIDKETRTVVRLEHKNYGVLDGTSFAWSNVGSLEEVTTYKDGKMDGKYERYLECLPIVLGQYKDGVPSGVWQIFPEPGQISIIRNFDRPIPDDKRPSDLDKNAKAFWTEWFNGSGVKIAEGYSVSENPDDNGFRVGEIMLYTTSGQKWMPLKYAGTGRISDDRSFKLCAPDDKPNAPIPAYLDYDHESLTMTCKDAGLNVYAKIDFYSSGEMRKKAPYENGSENGMVREYHPNQSILAEYEMKNGVPEGKIVYQDAHGNPFGESYVHNGSGTFKSWWHNGNPHEEITYTNGKKTGTWTVWLESGTKVSETQYDSKGRPDGYRRQWFHNGLLSVELQYKEGSFNGISFYNYSDGRTADRCMYKDGMPTGKCDEYAHSGNLSYQTDYTNFLNVQQTQFYSDGNRRSTGRITPGFGHGSREGTWDFYLKNGKKWLSVEYNGNAVMQPEAVACRQINGAEYSVDEEKREVGCLVCSVNRTSPLNPLKMREGLWKWYSATGNLEKSGSIHLGHLNGEWDYYYSNGKKMLAGEYKIDQRVGQWTGYYEDGNKRFSGRYADGRETGKWETYHPVTGTVSSAGTFKEGLRDGEWVYSYPDGSVKEKGQFENGLETGIWTSYYANGQKQGEGSFVSGKREGKWTWYRENGAEWRTAEYKEGREVKK